MHDDSLHERLALVTGAAHRVGAAIVKALHGAGARVVIHSRQSRQAAEALAEELNGRRLASAFTLQADLARSGAPEALMAQLLERHGRLDVLVNNASSFYPTPVGEVSEAQWEDLMASNLKAPFFLSQAAMAELGRRRGSIVNIVDIHAERPLKNYAVYCMAKAGLVMQTKALARELGPAVRVNAVAPGAILWPEGLDAASQQEIIGRTALKRRGEPEDIARAVLYLVRDAAYTTGQVLAVDGGRSLQH